jgi:hypothetical protein
MTRVVETPGTPTRVEASMTKEVPTMIRLSVPVRLARIGYAMLSSVFVICVLVQVFFAGMGAFGADWSLHLTFVHFLELAEREGWREQAEGYRRLIELESQHRQRGIHHGSVPRRQRWNLIEREPACLTANRWRRSGGDESEIGDRKLRFAGMPELAARRNDLSRPRGTRA